MFLFIFTVNDFIHARESTGVINVVSVYVLNVARFSGLPGNRDPNKVWHGATHPTA